MSHADISDHPAVKEIIYARRFETITLHRILQGFSTSECDWLMPPGPQLRVSVSDALKRRELLEEFLFWYFDGFILPLLKVSMMIERRLKF
jgi:telomerase reverse transcriptase